MNNVDSLINHGLLIGRASSGEMHKLIAKELLDIAHGFCLIDGENLTLNNLHEYIGNDQINDYRLKALNRLNQKTFASNLIFKNLRDILINLLGNDLAIQKNVGLSIQFPNDSSSLLPIHSDVANSDCSPYELVIWIPLVDCYKTKSMFYLPFSAKESLEEYINLINDPSIQDPGDMYDKYQDQLEYINLQPPCFGIFSHSLWHGNQVNIESETRVSINLRVKNVFTPYKGKKIGDFFNVVEMSPLSAFFMNLEMAYDN